MTHQGRLSQPEATLGWLPNHLKALRPHLLSRGPAAHHSSILTGSTVTEFEYPAVGRAETLSRKGCGDKGMLPACVCLDMALSKQEDGLPALAG